MMHRDELFQHLDELLAVDRFRDYCPNGLQIEGRSEIKKVALGVSVSLALVQAAIKSNADALIVHHGFYWRGDPQVVRGFRKQRLQSILGADLNLGAYHLPLDAHPTLGNNAQLADALGLKDRSTFGKAGGQPIGLLGVLPEATPAAEVVRQIGVACGSSPLSFSNGPALVRKVGIITGRAGKMMNEAALAGADLFVTGEPEEPAMAMSVELGIHFVAAGHYNTETFGVRALVGHLQSLGLEAEFISIPNPV